MLKQAEWAALIVGSVAIGVRLWVASWLPLQEDEAATLMERSAAMLLADEERYFNPLPWRAATVWLNDATDALLWKRWPSIAFSGCAAAVLTVHAGRRFGVFAGYIAGAGLALTPWLVRQNAQFRSYGLTLLAAVLVAIAVADTLARGGKRRTWLCALVVGSACWAHYGLLCWLPVGVLVIWTQRDTGGRWALAAVAAMVALAAWPLSEAATGLSLKRALAGAPLLDWRLVDLVWQPEPLLAVGVGIAGWHGRKRPGLPIFAAVSVALLLAWLALGQQVPTVRWGHLACVVPALWLALSWAISSESSGRHRWQMAIASIVALWWVTALITGSETGAVRADDKTLAAYLRQLGGHWQLLEERDGHQRPRALGVAAELGYFRGGPDRCVGADVVHQRRCRGRVTVVGGVRIVCLGRTCVGPIDDAPEPLATSSTADEKPENTGVALLFGQCSEADDTVCAQVGRWAVTTAVEQSQ